MTRVALISVVAYGLMLLLVGLAGIGLARWELTHLFAVAPDATFLNQYRFLKAVEMGSGVFCLVFCRDIIGNGRSTLPFLVLVAAGVVARSIAWVVDGRPSWPFTVFLVLEAVVLVLVILELRRRRID